MRKKAPPASTTARAAAIATGLRRAAGLVTGVMVARVGELRLIWKAVRSLAISAADE